VEQQAKMADLSFKEMNCSTLFHEKRSFSSEGPNFFAPAGVWRTRPERKTWRSFRPAGCRTARLSSARGIGLEAGEQEPQKRQGGIKVTGPTLADHIEKSMFSEDYRVFTTHSSRNRNAGLSPASPHRSTQP